MNVLNFFVPFPWRAGRLLGIRGNLFGLLGCWFVADVESPPASPPPPPPSSSRTKPRPTLLQIGSLKCAVSARCRPHYGSHDTGGSPESPKPKGVRIQGLAFAIFVHQSPSQRQTETVPKGQIIHYSNPEVLESLPRMYNNALRSKRIPSRTPPYQHAK